MLLIGYGNPGRGDDGLGQEFATRIAAAQLPGVESIVDYQLSVEHALMVSQSQQVVFADAMEGGEAPFSFGRVSASTEENLTSHNLSPATVLGLAAVLYGKCPEAYVMAIAGYAFEEVKEGIGPAALRNLDLAVAHFLAWHAGQ